MNSGEYALAQLSNLRYWRSEGNAKETDIRLLEVVEAPVLEELRVSSRVQYVSLLDRRHAYRRAVRTWPRSGTSRGRAGR